MRMNSLLLQPLPAALCRWHGEALVADDEVKLAVKVGRRPAAQCFTHLHSLCSVLLEKIPKKNNTRKKK
jgi:hypothetical protein